MARNYYKWSHDIELKSRRNHNRAWRLFEKEGLIPKDRKPFEYVLHHKDETLIHTDIERYIKWLPEDLEVVTRAEHNTIHFKGYKMPEERKQYLREKLTGENNPLYGKPFTEEHKRHISETHWDTSGDKNPRARKVMYVPEKKVFTTISALIEYVGIPRSTFYYWVRIGDKRVKYVNEGVGL